LTASVKLDHIAGKVERMKGEAMKKAALHVRLSYDDWHSVVIGLPDSTTEIDADVVDGTQALLFRIRGAVQTPGIAATIYQENSGNCGCGDGRSRRPGRCLGLAEVTGTSLMRASGLRSPTLILATICVSLLTAPGPPSDRRLVLAVGGSVVVDSQVDMDRALVANPAVAELAAVSVREFVVTGVGSGETSLILWPKEGARMLYDVTVPGPVPPLIASLRRAPIRDTRE
jgi:hypothetical protein